MMSSTNEIMVSVCIQTYEHAGYIEQCLDSALSQKTSFIYEIILGEDDSKDGTREICIRYAEKYPDKIRLFLRSEKDKIYIDGKKTGRYNFLENLKAAKGKYIAWLDGDDYWTDNIKLQKQVEWMEKNPDCNISYHKIYYQKQKGQLVEKPAEFWQPVNKKLTIKDLFFYECFISPVSCMLRAEKMKPLPDWFLKVPQMDFPLFLYCSKYSSIGFLEDTMGVYRTHPKGSWTNTPAPGNTIKYWNMYKILYHNLGKEFQVEILRNRYKTGKSLIKFYKTHLWYKKEWLKSELEMNEFKCDERLMRKLKAYPGIKNYFMNIINIGVEFFRVLKRMFRAR